MFMPTHKDATLRAVLVWAGLLSMAGSAAYGQSTSNGDYIDSAIPENLFRARFEALYRMDRSDRAEFVYSKGFAPSIDNQDYSMYLELAATPRLSGFVELHEHVVHQGPFIEPTGTVQGQPGGTFDFEGFGDMNTGLKYAFLYNEGEVVTLQLRTYIPTGMPKVNFLGTGHVTLNPALLYNRQLTDRLTFEGEFQDCIPIGGSSDSAGNVIRYGAGLNYRAVDTGYFKLIPVIEFVGWTVLSGQKSIGETMKEGTSLLVPVPEDATGHTIVNAKMGVRLGFGDHSDVYMGYGRALTGDVWYKDMLRVEYRLRF